MASSRNYRLIKVLAETVGLENLAAMEVEAVKDRPVPQRLIKALTDESRLTPRRREIMVLIASGYTQQEVADELGISYWAVKKHLTIIYRTLNVRNRIEAINAFIENEA